MINRRDPARRMVLPAVSSAGANPLPPLSGSLMFFGDFDAASTVITGGAVETWGDSSGNARAPTQATAGFRPAYVASDVRFGGLAVMTFDGVDDYLAYSSMPSEAAMSFYSVLAAEIAVQSGPVAYVGAANSANAGIGQFNDSFYGIFSSPTAAEVSAVIAPAVVVSEPAVAAVTVDAAAGGDCVKAYLDSVDAGAPFATGAVAGVTPNLPLYLGGDSTSFSNVTVACVLVYSAVHTAGEVATVTAWLQARYSL